MGGSECVLLTVMYWDDSALKPSDYNPPRFRIHPGPLVYLCSGSAAGTDQTSAMGDIPDPKASCGWRIEPGISLAEDPFGICKYERGVRLGDTKFHHNCRGRGWEKFLRSASSVKIMSNLCSSLSCPDTRKMYF